MEKNILRKITIMTRGKGMTGFQCKCVIINQLLVMLSHGCIQMFH